jgi:antagonist of KipI
MAMKLIRGGMLTTVQDLGRPGFRAAGVPSGGAMDGWALRLINLLVGNAEQAAGLEMTLVGPEIEFSKDAVIAVAGTMAGAPEPWRPHHIRAGERVILGRLINGCRAYLAVSGGLDVPEVLGGRGTDLRAGWGGWQGRALREGDVLPVGLAGAAPVVGNWWLDPGVYPLRATEPVLRFVRGAQADEFSADCLKGAFMVQSQSDRMGLRFKGPVLTRISTEELISTAVMPGTVQVPPDGQPIVLGVDAQTIGGYPQVAHVISMDLSVLAQLRPGDQVHFQEVSLAEAHHLLRKREETLAILREGLAKKLR